MQKQDISALESILDYDPVTGVFKRDGLEAGYIDRYVRITVNSQKYYAHQLAWLFVYGYWPHEIDHINGIKTDNRIHNLREVERLDNCKNTPLRRDNRSGVPGVIWREKRKAFTVQIGVKNEIIYLGSYGNFLDAAAAKKAAENKYGFHSNHGRIG